MTLPINTMPVLLNLKEFPILIIGGSGKSPENTRAILNHCPMIRIVAEKISDELKELTEENRNVELIESTLTEKHLEGIRLIISTISDDEFSEYARDLAKSRGILFSSCEGSEPPIFLGSNDNKDDLLIGNPDNSMIYPLIYETDEVLENLYEDPYNASAIKKNFSNASRIALSVPEARTKEEKILGRVKKASIYSLVVILLMIIGHLLFSLLPYDDPYLIVQDLFVNLDKNFWKYAMFGFIAQMIDGALGMAYGVSVTTFLLGAGITGITPAIASASMHASEIFTTGSSSLVYMRFRNINMKLFRSLVWPGLIGAVLGVITVSFVSKEYFNVIKPMVAVYTLTLGVIIILRAFKKPKKRKKVKNIYPIAFSGGFLDSIGGGGWGPIVTSSLLAGGRHLRYAVGSAHLAKFFVAVVSTVTFFFMIGLSHWQVIIGLVIGGMIAAPFSIYLSNKIPIKKGLLLVGMLIISISIRTLVKVIL